MDPNIKRVYDVGIGTYDVTVSVGPSYQTKRQEAVQTQMALVQAEPQLLNIIGDILVGNMDIPGAPEIAKRMKAILPPALQDSDDPMGKVQQVMAQNAQLQQQMQELTALLKQQHDIIETKTVETQGKVQIAQFQEMSKQ